MINPTIYLKVTQLTISVALSERIKATTYVTYINTHWNAFMVYDVIIFDLLWLWTAVSSKMNFGSFLLETYWSEYCNWSVCHFPHGAPFPFLSPEQNYKSAFPVNENKQIVSTSVHHTAVLLNGSSRFYLGMTMFLKCPLKPLNIAV